MRGMKILQELPARCSCALCDDNCKCGDCSICSNVTLDSNMSKYAKRAAVAVCIFLALGGFVFFVPVVALGATPPVRETISVRVQTADNTTLPFASIGFCYLGVGAVLVHGVYYPSVALNQTARRTCK